jgi:hypothetical protein
MVQNLIPQIGSVTSSCPSRSFILKSLPRRFRWTMRVLALILLFTTGIMNLVGSSLLLVERWTNYRLSA